jgi:hypothetical protein
VRHRVARVRPAPGTALWWALVNAAPRDAQLLADAQLNSPGVPLNYCRRAKCAAGFLT